MLLLAKEWTLSTKQFLLLSFIGVMTIILNCGMYANIYLQQNDGGAKITPITKPEYSNSTLLNDNMVHQTSETTRVRASRRYYSCLQSDKDIDDSIKQASQIVIAMPAKAAGTTVKYFTKDCIGDKYDLPDNFLNNPSKEGMKNVLLTGKPLEMPKVISSHMYTDTPLRSLIGQLPKSVLLLYIHREESERLKSAIKQIYATINLRPKLCNIAFDEKNKTCVTGENQVIATIVDRTAEIGFGEMEILTCETYDAIKNNAPNMIFMHYKQVDKLQKMLAKYHCPHMLEEGLVQKNVAHKKEMTTLVRIGENGDDDVTLEDWIAAKADMLSFALRLRDTARSCQGSTREMEEDLFGCTTEFVHV